ncbi:MAG: SDR family oxidoreductase [Okeania sp. SIO3B5]|uniref:SDR family NAD(P)-dependent oxidoreductase n=1 Tax=Okeania sp. SIO3B5 TaxID=2607811 RepID=UPI0014016408|nr:SDR family oxidoreductase [Okeania sp. SIO3B5]NEO53097.1 SDR family oxidoreductase [Okeania sp. SIO3B5]
MSQVKFLESRVAIVTGGTSGIGKAIAIALAQSGANVAVGSRSASTSSCQAEIESQGVKALVMNLDVSLTNSVQAFYDATLDSFGKVDILVNAAGIACEHTICNHPDEDWYKVIDINLNGIYRTTKLCLPGMIERKWGRIINIASTYASVGVPLHAAYCTSKAAILGLTRCVALEGAPHGVSCNSISPGWVETKMATEVATRLAETEGRTAAEYLEEIKESYPQKRLIQPQEVGELAVFLCRDEALGITMEDITISAGSLW